MTDRVTRRQFLQGTAALTASLAVGACTQSAPDEAAEPGGTLPGAGTDGILVVITLAGGNDALNTVAPVEDPTYRSMRGALAIDALAAHDIGEGLALHPALVRGKGLWDAGQLAVVHGVGFAELDRSHFHCMDVWQAGDTNHVGTGWLGRWLDLGGNDPLDAVSVGPRLPLLVRGARRSAAVVPTGPFALPGTASLRTRLEGWSPTDDASDLRSLVVRSTADLLTVVDSVAPMVAETTDDDSLSAQLGSVAALIRGGTPTRVFAVELAGFDTHAEQSATHAALLGELDAALGAFLDEVADPRVTVLVYSEFGRRVAPNGSQGTDHGSAGTVLLAGTVRPGHHGEPPPLDALVAGDLATTIDFRAVYGGLLEGVLGVEAADVLPDAPTPLHLV
jgi:uncharacterized protein (DUF1501 family)